MEEKRVIIYNRVSTVTQEKADSLNEQTDECIRFCNSKKYKIVKIFKDVKTGTTSDRDGYKELKKHIQKKDFDTLVVLEISRLGRTMKELLFFFEDLNKQEIEFISLREPAFNTNTPDGKFLMNIRLSAIQFERDNTANRVTERLYFKAGKGQWITGNPPMGYKLINKKLVIDEEKAPIIRGVFNDFLEGHSLCSISAKNNFTWGSRRVKRILTNPVYKGYIRYGNRSSDGKKGKKEPFLVKGWQEPIIPEKDYDLAQELLKRIPKVVPVHHKPALLSGLLKCKHCGANVLRKRGNTYNKNLYYGCNMNWLIYSDKLYYKDHEKCTAGTIKGELLEKAVIEALKEEIKKLDFNTIEVSKDVNNDKKVISNKIKKNKARLERIYELYIDGEIPKDKYISEKHSLEEEILLLENQSFDNQEKEKKVSNNELIKSYFEKLDLTDVVEANKILKIIIKKIVVYRYKKAAKDDFELEIYLNI